MQAIHNFRLYLNAHLAGGLAESTQGRLNVRNEDDTAQMYTTGWVDL